DGGTLYACAGKEKDKRNTFAEKFKIVQAFDTYPKLARCPEIDVIYIATPHSFHYEHTLLCLNNKKPVLCEKPLGVNFEQVTEMFRCARENHVFLMEAMWTAFLPNIVEIQQVVKNNTIGAVLHLKADFGFQAVYDETSRLFDPKLAGGALLDIGIYPVFMSLIILGKPLKITASAHIAPSGVDSSCAILFSYENGATASLYCSFDVHTDTTCDLFGTKGSIRIPGRFHEQDHYFQQLNDEPVQKITTGRTGLGYFQEIEHVHHCLNQGLKQSPVMDFNMSASLIEILDEIRNQIGVMYSG
ncbi:MAG: Gfo/Idh/MocA family oxidoreductase, partial [Saprospiraceae bacterium]|nr:Gfo/Idh/MocA family oxidoreductase [Saprospiraceae bacterium]